ncbi:MAG: hypothetical protein Q9182_002081 [Xanthomendoza sp. 2 TL-2023]
MSTKIPEGFTSVSALSSNVNREVNLMGVVTDFLPPARSRGRDWTCNFRLADDTAYNDGVKVQIFRPMEAELPQVQGLGDVIILQKIKISSWNGMTTGLSTRSTSCTVIPATTIPETVPRGQINLNCVMKTGSSVPTQQQMRYAIELCNSRDRSARSSTNPAQSPAKYPSLTATPSSTGRRDKFALIKDLQIEKFYDLIGQVVKIYPSNGAVELYITDYTTNGSLFNYVWGHGDDEHSERPKWRGPLGKQTLTVSLFSPHSYYAQDNVREDQYVFLRNVRIKYSKDLKMEGCLHTDKYYSDRVDISILKDHDDDRLKDLLRRKLEYTKKWSQHKDGFTEIHEGQKRKQKEEPKLSKIQARKRRKLQREEETKKRKQQATPSSDEEQEKKRGTNNTDVFQVHITPTTKGVAYHHTSYSTPSTSPSFERTPPNPTTTLNKNVRASYPEYPIRPVSNILLAPTFATPNGLAYKLPFQNVKSRACVRVVDFSPHDLADFAVKKSKGSEYDVLSDYEGTSSSDEEEAKVILPPDTDEEDNEGNGSDLDAGANVDAATAGTQEWEWRFALILQDASSRSEKKEMAVYVAGADAEFLLKLDACNLRRRPQQLAALREKLFLLWGDLEERKAARFGEGSDAEEEEKRTEERKKEKANGIPFECCIKQYAIRNGDESDDEESSDTKDPELMGGWDRMFRMFGTTIL